MNKHMWNNGSFFYVQIEKMGSEKSVIRDIIIVTNSMKLVRRKLKI